MPCKSSGNCNLSMLHSVTGFKTFHVMNDISRSGTRVISALSELFKLKSSGRSSYWVTGLLSISGTQQKFHEIWGFHGDYTSSGIWCYHSIWIEGLNVVSDLVLPSSPNFEACTSLTHEGSYLISKVTLHGIRWEFKGKSYHFHTINCPCFPPLPFPVLHAVEWCVEFNV
jgi:hypothetical protein